VDLLYSPKQLAGAVAPWLALLLAAAGITSLVFERFVARPEILRFSTEGRRVAGRVLGSPTFNTTGSRGAGPRNRSLVGVTDNELGLQVVSVYGVLPTGNTVPMICLTPARRCMSAGEVNERLDLWPLTPLMLSGAVELGLAATLSLAARRRRRRPTARRASADPSPTFAPR
jgi:hypothetical protein